MMNTDKKYTCPICGYPELDEPPYLETGEALYEICPCCNIQYGYTDLGGAFAQLRDEWIEEGCPWRGIEEHKPSGWNAKEQLRRFE
jgi:hypothetical protein